MKTSNERAQSIKQKVTAKRRNRKLIFTSATTACVLIVATVICSLPILGAYAPSVNGYKNDEYYPLIQKINARYDEDKHSIFEDLGSLGMVGDASTAAPPTASEPTDESSGATTNNNKYEETTLNQVDGIIEGDILKRSTTHAFYLKNGYSKNAEPCLALDVYKLAGDNTKKVTEYFIRARDNTSFSKYSSYIEGEMFLNDDATRATIIAPCISERSVVYTTVISLDISDVANVKEVNRVYVSGRYLSSRKVDGKLLVVTNFTVGRYGYYGYGQVEYDQKDTYIPRCGDMSASSFIPMDNIYVPDNCPSLSYTVLAMLDEDTLNVADKYAVFSYTQDVGVFADKLVVMRNSYCYYKDDVEYGKEIQEKEINWSRGYTSAHMSEMVVLNYVDGFKKVGAIGLDGHIKDRYSLDVKDNVLRVFTSVWHSTRGQNGTVSTMNVSLYCVDISTMEIIASKQQFAPQGDEVKSVRFDGNVAYVCTARRNTDPVFYFDLSDLSNITYVDTGEIEGFSVNLIKFNDLLLGIGEGAERGTLKVEAYKESNDAEAVNGVVGVAKYEDYVSFSADYKAHFVNAEHNLVGLQVYDYGYKYGDNWVTSEPVPAPGLRYLLLHYNETTQQFEVLSFEYFDCGESYARSFYEHNGVYVFGQNGHLFINLQEKA